MSLENFLNYSVDSEVINRYLNLLAQYQCQLEQTNRALSERLREALLEVEPTQAELKQLKGQLDRVNAELSVFKQQPKATETRIGQWLTRDDGTALDTKTGLMWCRYSIGQRWENGNVVGKVRTMTWNEAMKCAKSFNRLERCGGFTDWRMPTIDELKSLVEKGKSPSIRQTDFPNTPKKEFWSSSPDEGGANYAWNVDFHDGYVDGSYRGSSLAVRLVRAS